MSKVKFQHYVPRFYLEKFCNADGRVWVYDKHLNKTYCTKPENVGGQTYFYDVPEVDEAAGVPQFIEKALGQGETLGAIVVNRWLRKLESNSPFRIYAEGREIFARFLAHQLFRTPYHRNLAIQTAALSKKAEFKAFLETRHPELAQKPFEMVLNPDFAAHLHSNVLLDVEALEECVAILQRHIWIVCPNGSEQPFLTSDNPVTRHAHKSGFGVRSFSGYASPGIQLMFPLSPRFTLTLAERTFFKCFEKLDGKLRPAPLTIENVTHENSCQVRRSTRFLFSSTDDFTLARDMCARTPELADPSRALFQSSHPEHQNPGTIMSHRGNGSVPQKERRKGGKNEFREDC